MSKIAILLSGGIDSTAIAYWKRPEIGLTIDYGQKSAEGELRAASAIANQIGIQHHTISVDCSKLGSGDLAGTEPHPEAPESEWWPYRNQLLVTLAVMRAIALGVDTLLVGSISSDSFHKDGTAEFYAHLNDLVSMQEGRIRVLAPALDLDALELIAISRVPFSLLGWTHSCHKARYACGRCRGCNKSQEVFRSILR